MKVVWWVPLTFLAGAHGFLMFIPYLLALLATRELLRVVARHR